MTTAESPSTSRLFRDDIETGGSKVWSLRYEYIDDVKPKTTSFDDYDDWLPNILSPAGDPVEVGAAPVHITFDVTEKYLFVAVYSGGALAAVPFDESGALGEPTSIVQARRLSFLPLFFFLPSSSRRSVFLSPSRVRDHSKKRARSSCSVAGGNGRVQHYGSGVDPARQEAPHVHGTVVAPGAKGGTTTIVYACDLGLDRVFWCDAHFDGATSTRVRRLLFLSGGCEQRQHLLTHDASSFGILSTSWQVRLRRRHRRADERDGEP